MAASTANDTSNEYVSNEDLMKEVEQLKHKLEEERAKFNDVECILIFKHQSI
jgi:hypothetical protein